MSLTRTKLIVSSWISKQIVDSAARTCDDDIPCRFEIEDKMVVGKLTRSFDVSLVHILETKDVY